ncbi:MAG: hypothetical protein Q4D21_04375 [Phascolarctobacterium sp.]|nr:hypothetical protein [Phascolarctobacterium sp.]
MADRIVAAHREAGQKDYTCQDAVKRIALSVPGLKDAPQVNGVYNQFEAEIESVRKQYEGTEQWMKAPNGQSTNLTERQ